jgi:hypothetical protein
MQSMHPSIRYAALVLRRFIPLIIHSKLTGRMHKSVRRRNDDPTKSDFLRGPSHLVDKETSRIREMHTSPCTKTSSSSSTSRFAGTISDWRPQMNSPTATAASTRGYSSTSPPKPSKAHATADAPAALSFVPLHEHTKAYSQFRSRPPGTRHADNTSAKVIE